MNLSANEFNHIEVAIKLYYRFPDIILLCFTNKKRRREVDFYLIKIINVLSKYRTVLKSNILIFTFSTILVACPPFALHISVMYTNIFEIIKYFGYKDLFLFLNCTYLS